MSISNFQVELFVSFLKKLADLEDEKYSEILNLKIENDANDTVLKSLQKITDAVRSAEKEEQKKEKKAEEMQVETPSEAPPKEEPKEIERKSRTQPYQRKDIKTEEMQVETPSEATQKEEPKEIERKSRTQPYQRNDIVVQVFYIKKLTHENVKIQFNDKSFDYEIAHPDGFLESGRFQLTNEIDREKSKWEVNPYKVIVTLKKKVSGIWDELFVETKNSQVVTSPWQTKRDWSEVKQNIEKELKDEKEGDPMMSLFKGIYGDADENTRRAMIKSFQTSNGTVLSTNWDEVKTKDYEGKDAVPPTGQEVHKWKDYM